MALPDNSSRVYMIAGTQHGGRAGAHHRPRPQRQSAQPAQSHAGGARAAGGARRRVGVGQVAPPPSRVPTLADGTLVEPDKTGFPAIPGAAVVTVDQPRGAAGRLGEPSPPSSAYRTLVCTRRCRRGNEVAGIRLPDIAVPLATYTGWNEYKPPYPDGRDRRPRRQLPSPFRPTRRAIRA